MRSWWDYVFGDESQNNNTDNQEYEVYIAKSEEDILAARNKMDGERIIIDGDGGYVCCRERRTGDLVGVVGYTKDLHSRFWLFRYLEMQADLRPPDSTVSLYLGMDIVHTAGEKILQQMITQAMRITQSTHFAIFVRPNAAAGVQQLADATKKQCGSKMLTYHDNARSYYQYTSVLFGTDLTLAADVMRTRALNCGLHRLPPVDDGMMTKLTYCGLSVFNLIRTVLPATAWPNLVWPVARHEDHLASVLQLLKQTTSKSAPTLAPVVARQLRRAGPTIFGASFYPDLVERFLHRMDTAMLQQRAEGLAQIANNPKLIEKLHGPTVISTDWSNVYDFSSSASRLADEHAPFSSSLSKLLLQHRDDLRSATLFELWTLNPPRYGVEYLSKSASTGKVGGAALNFVTHVFLAMSMYQWLCPKSLSSIGLWSRNMVRAHRVYRWANSGAFLVTLGINTFYSTWQRSAWNYSADQSDVWRLQLSEWYQQPSTPKTLPPYDDL